MKQFFVAISGTILQAVIGFATVIIFMGILKAKSNLVGKAFDRTKGLVNKTRERAQGSGFYQRRKMASENRQGERKRTATESYANMMTGNGIRSRILRRRAGGGAEGRQRAQQSAQDILRKQRHDETARAAQRMVTAGFEGDNDYMNIARAGIGTTVTSRAGVQMRVTHAEQQAAINNLVQQGRTGSIRTLEALQARGPGGAPHTELHQMLDEAYTDVGQKLAEKAPDLMPSRRATNGVAAFTDLKPEDVAAWHDSTVAAAEVFYNTPRLVTDPATGVTTNMGPVDREQMLRAFSQATQNPSTRSKLSLGQVTAVRTIMQGLPATDPTRMAVEANIDGMYTTLGGV